MELMADDRMWPSIPPGLKYVDLRLPGTFRELVENRSFTHEEIGRIVRCIALDTDFFMTQKIEPEVFYYRRKLIEKNKTRMRVEAHRRRKDAESAGQLSADMVRGYHAGSGVTVTPAQNTGAGDTLFSVAKTPSINVEKTPPIVPLEKKPSSPLESAPVIKRPRTKQERLAAHLQDDLFSLACGSEGHGRSVGSPEMPSGSHVGASGGSDVSTVVQDIGRAPGPVSGGLDTRVDAAWIPERFAVFWDQYPRHIGKCSAQRAFTKLIKSQKNVEKFMETLLNSLNWWKQQESWKESLLKNKGKFIPYPATWLNRGSWEDATENKECGSANSAEFLNTSSESDEELLRRMQGGTDG